MCHAAKLYRYSIPGQVGSMNEHRDACGGQVLMSEGNTNSSVWCGRWKEVRVDCWVSCCWCWVQCLQEHPNHKGPFMPPQPDGLLFSGFRQKSDISRLDFYKDPSS